MNQFKKPEKSEKKKRVRIVKAKVDPKKFKKAKSQKKQNFEISPEEAQKRVRETLAKLQGGGKKSSVKNRKEKRLAHKEVAEEEDKQKEASDKVIKIAEFATSSELATLMDVEINEIVKTCMSLGMMVSMNQRLDAETIQMLVEDFGFKVEFVGVDVQESIDEIIDAEKELEVRAPIITIMGNSFASRVATSILKNVGLENLVTKKKAPIKGASN